MIIMVFSVSNTSMNINNIFIEYVVSLLESISAEYDIDLNELKDKYLDFNPSVKKRGRKKKIKDEYIETEEFDFNGKVYLVDANNVVYSNNVKNPVMLGKKKTDGTITFF